MVTTTADLMVKSLLDWGVEVIFGLPGDGNNGIMESLRKQQDRIRFIKVRHEESAAFMACAYAKYTGRLGVCLTTGAPGAIHLLNGLYDAKADGASVLAITGNTQHDLMQTYGQQDLPLDLIFRDVSVYSNRIMGAAHVENVTDLACRHALAYHGVAHITFPIDLQVLAVENDWRSSRNPPHHTSDVPARGMVIPELNDLHKAAAILNTGKRVAILAGQGALHATRELLQIAEKLGAPIAKALLGKAAVPDDSPYTTGTIGFLGTHATREVMAACDTLLMVGTSFPFIEFLPLPGQARGVQIDLDPARIGLRYPVEVGLVGDSRLALQQLIPLLEPKNDRNFLENAQNMAADWWKKMEEIGSTPTLPMKPQVVAWELGKRLEDNAILSCDSGMVTHWWARQVKARSAQMHSVSGNSGSMSCALPYTIAAQVAYPDRQCVAMLGDGSFSMQLGEFITAVQHKLPIKVVVFKNNTLGAIKWEQEEFFHNPEYGTELAPIDFSMFARACGAAGFSVDEPSRVGAILDQAFSTPGPVIIEAVVDPNEMPHKGDY